MRRIIWILFFLFPGIEALAQYSYSASTSGNINIYSIQSLTLTGGSVIPSFSSLNDYANGITVNDYLSVAIKSNVSWTLSVNAQNTYFSPMSQGGSTNMPSTVLSIKTSSSSNYFNITTTSQTLKTGNKGNTTSSGNSFDIDIKYNPGFSYKGGIYTLGLIYTLTQQ